MFRTQAKYVGRMYVAAVPPQVQTGPGGRAHQLSLLLWHAVEAGDVRAALQAIAWGADPAAQVRGTEGARRHTFIGGPARMIQEATDAVLKYRTHARCGRRMQVRAPRAALLINEMREMAAMAPPHAGYGASQHGPSGACSQAVSGLQGCPVPCGATFIWLTARLSSWNASLFLPTPLQAAAAWL